MYSEIEQLLWTDIRDQGLYDSPYPTMLGFLNKFFFDMCYEVVLLAWSYKKTECCSNLTPDTIFYLCCPGCDRSGAAQAHLDQLYGVTDIDEDDVLADMGNMANIIGKKNAPNVDNKKNNSNNNSNNSKENKKQQNGASGNKSEKAGDLITEQITQQEKGTTKKEEQDERQKQEKNEATTKFDETIREAKKEIEEREKYANENESKNNTSGKNDNNTTNDSNKNKNNNNNATDSNQGGTERRQTNHFDTPYSGPTSKEDTISNVSNRDHEIDVNHAKRNTISNAPSTFDPTHLLNGGGVNDDNISNSRVRVAIFDFEHTLLPNHRSFYKNTVPTVKLLPMQDIILKFGGEDRIDMLRQHLDYVSKTHNCLLFLMTREYSEVIQIVLEKLQLSHYFVSNDYKKKLKLSKAKEAIGSIVSNTTNTATTSSRSRHNSKSRSKVSNKKGVLVGDQSPMATINESQTRTLNLSNATMTTMTLSEGRDINGDDDSKNVENGLELSQRILGWDNALMSDYTTVQSRNVAILSIMKITDCTYDELLYIDYDISTIEHINRINLCQTYHIKHRRGLTVNDVHSIQQKFFWQ